MNEEKFEQVGTENEKKVNAVQKLKKIGVAIVKIAGPLAIGAAVGYVARKYVDKDVYADAKTQREYRERKNSINN
jgi:hypothetical protein